MHCNHLSEPLIFCRNLYGDEINQVSPFGKTYRSKWKCPTCGKIIYREYLQNSENEGKEIQPLDVQDAFMLLKNYFLGEDWYSIYYDTESVNADIVETIMEKYKTKAIHTTNLE